MTSVLTVKVTEGWMRANSIQDFGVVKARVCERLSLGITVVVSHDNE